MRIHRAKNATIGAIPLLGAAAVLRRPLAGHVRRAELARQPVARHGHVVAIKTAKRVKVPDFPARRRNSEESPVGGITYGDEDLVDGEEVAAGDFAAGGPARHARVAALAVRGGELAVEGVDAGDHAAFLGVALLAVVGLHDEGDVFIDELVVEPAVAHRGVGGREEHGEVAAGEAVFGVDVRGGAREREGVVEGGCLGGGEGREQRWVGCLTR